MARTPSCDKSGMRKGTWTAEEDRKLIAYVTRYGCWNWRQLPKFAGLSRCGKSCRLRWLNYLRPNIKRGNFNEQEEELIIRMHKKLGNRWSTIAAELPGRTDNEVKNHWHTSLKKRAIDNIITNEETKSTKSKDTTGPLSPFSSSSEFSSTSSDQSSNDFGFLDSFIESVDKSFWLDDLSSTPSGIVKDNSTVSHENFSSHSKNVIAGCGREHSIVRREIFASHSSNENFVQENHFGSYQDGYIESTFDSFWTQPYETNMTYVTSELLAPLPMESEYFSILYDEDIWS